MWCFIFGAVFMLVSAFPSPAHEARWEQAKDLAASLDDRRLAAQVIMTGIDGRGSLGSAMADILRDVPAGALMLFRYNLTVSKEEVRSFLSDCGEFIGGLAGIPPFIAVDHEGGSVHRFGAGVEKLPPALHWGEQAQTLGREAALAGLEEAAGRSAREIHDLGVNLNLAPVAEILNDDNRAFLDDRSFGPDAEFTAAASAVFVKAMEEAGVGCVAKHFPGNSAADPHSVQSVIAGGRDAVDAMAAPFAVLGASGLAGIMVSHALIPARDPAVIASLSPAVMGDWLRGEMGFEGFILADDFSMAGASVRELSPEAAAVISLAAGADMVMAWPGNLRSLHREILSAMKQGRLPRERLEEAAARIIAAKLALGIIKIEAE
ncbi:MAG: glycoside hydrolase family 3 protein [Treponema sp.]|jgi:beta-N-acetylhexosaminidase|nr:glycoside hydrolase family 3 protein [Treponema sp.]